MIAKLVEIRDRGTFIVALATRMAEAPDTSPADDYLLGRAGYEGSECSIFLSRVEGDRMNQGTCDPREWDSRAMVIAHSYLMKAFEQIASGAVIDVEYLLGQRDQPRASERVER